MLQRKLGRAFERLRLEKLNMTQDDLGKVLGVSGNTISTWENTGNFKHVYFVLLEDLVEKRFLYRTIEERRDYILEKIKA